MAPPTPLSTAAIFAGGLAVGVGGALLLSRSQIAPGTKVSRNDRAKAQRAVSEAVEQPKAAAKKAVDAVAESAPVRAVAESAAAQKLAGAGAKAADETKAQLAGAKTAVEAKTQPVGASVHAITARALEEKKKLDAQDGSSADIKKPFVDAATPPTPKELQAPAHVAQTSMNLSGPLDAPADQTAPPTVPVWVSGVPDAERRLTAAGQIEELAYSSSTALFVYESAANGGLGAWAEAEAQRAVSKGFHSRTKVISMQTRTGAGTAIAGYVAERGSSSTQPVTAGALKKVVSVLANAQALVGMAPALAAMPVSDARLVLHVSSAAQAIDADGTGSLSVHNDYASVAAATAALSEATQPFAVVLSGSRSEAVAVAAAAYDAGAQGNNVVHVFDGAFAAREVAPLARAEAQIAPTLTQALAARGLSHFDYAGADNATTVLVVPNGPHFLAAKSMLARAADTSVGVLGVRVLRPWDDAALLAALPPSVRRIHVLDEVRAGSSGLLFDDVQAALLSDFTAAPRAVLPLALAAGQSLTAAQWAALLRAAADASDAINIATLEVDDALSAGILGAQRLATFLDGDSSPTSGLGALVSRALRASDSARGLTRFDNYTQGGVLRADIVLGAAAAQAEELPVALAAQAGSSTLVVAEAALLKGVAAFDNLAQGASVVLNASGWEVAEVEAKLSAADRRALAAANARLLLIDAASVAEQLAGGEKKAALPREVASAVLLAAFVHAHTGGDASAGEAVVRKTLGTAPLGPGGVPQLVAASIKALQTVAFDAAAWRAAEDDAAASRAVSGTYNAFAPNADTAVFAAAEGTAASSRATWALSAWQFLFSEAYALDERAVRPDLHEQTWLVKCTENRRLTPTDYDRNVFHLELSTAGTGLKYEVGEALGVHGWNDADEVREFLEWYGMDGNEVVSVPSIVAPGRWESRSVFQLLQQRLDIFGKPPKRFYEALSGVATNRDEARWLRFIAAAEGSATFKKLSEVETVTYADVLRMFPSARLPLDQLMAEVQPIEPRHYSIASAQSAVGDSVHLLIVTVDWQTPSGSARFGQCTRYLAALKPGDEVTVSLKPSIMKLPPITSQPIIMAGLGTGAAPFRAYIQARAVQKAQGKPVGPLIYCFGSRHEASEFLYGEELKAYERDGLITLLTAFSRDQKNKIYIQDRIREHAGTITKLLSATEEEHKGYACLCGPTWPVPDVTQALIDGFVDQGMSTEQAEEKIEHLKEEERYVLEVY